MPSAAPSDRAGSIGCVVLAAGRSRRFGNDNKLLAWLHARPLLWHVLDAVSASQARPIVIVTGHERAAIERSLRLYRLKRRHVPHWQKVFNPRYRLGMSTSLKAGLEALPEHVAGAVIMLADMPELGAHNINALIAARHPGDEAVVPVVAGRRANPVLLGRPIFARVQQQLAGDQGAKSLLRRSDKVREVAAGDGALLDIDTRRDLRRQQRRP